MRIVQRGLSTALQACLQGNLRPALRRPHPPPPPQIERLRAKLVAAEEAYAAADGIAQAAMEAAEEAVRDEMETIAGGWAGGPWLAGRRAGWSSLVEWGCRHTVGRGGNC